MAVHIISGPITYHSDLYFSSLTTLQASFVNHILVMLQEINLLILNQVMISASNWLAFKVSWLHFH
jgi:hypothetical protein